jgi:tetratricopeptide (TPR) repeat protein
MAHEYRLNKMSGIKVLFDALYKKNTRFRCPDCLFELTERYLERYQNEPSHIMEQAILRKALNCAKKACLINPGYCFGLADIGQCLIDADRLPDAVKFFESAYSFCPGMNYRQKGFANALRKAGRYREALKYYETYRLKKTVLSR